jgi:hypothetical protein
MSAEETDERYLRINAVETDHGLRFDADVNCTRDALLMTAYRLIEFAEKGACGPCQVHMKIARENLAALLPQEKTEFRSVQ